MFRVEKIYFASGHPAIISVDYFPCDLVKGELNREALEKESVFHLLRGHTGHVVARDKITMEAVERAEISKLIPSAGRMENDCLFLFQGVNYNRENMPIIFDYELYDTNYIKFGLPRKCDLRLEHVRLVNVFSGEIYETNIHIKNKRIVSISPEAELEAAEVMDCGGKYAVPGLIDAHMHFESTMLSPEALASVVVPQGTTTLCADLMEIANVAGAEGLKAMLQSIDRLPYRMLIEVSPRVPTAPGLETTGAVLGPKEVAEIMDWDESVSLGDLDPSKILFVKDEYIHKVADTLAKRKIVNATPLDTWGRS